jgi:hypothetical protein
MHGRREEVLLWQAELGQAELQAVRQHLVPGSPLWAGDLLRQWEERWAREWQCQALAFADPQALFGALRVVYGWPRGLAVALDPLLDPVWGEAVRAAGLLPCWPDLDPESGAVQGAVRDAEGRQQGEVTVHLQAAGCATTGGESRQGVLQLTEISAQPMATAASGGCAGLQVYYGGGQQWLAAGGSALLLSQDAALLAALRPLRHRLPSALACALGLAQWTSLPYRWQRRQALRERYGLLRGHGHWRMPPEWEQDRCWPLYVLRLPSQTARQALQSYLQRAAIAAAPPCWFTLPSGAVHWPGWGRFNGERLALPFHAALADAVHKRIINRLNRWSGLQVSSRPVAENQEGPS